MNRSLVAFAVIQTGLTTFKPESIQKTSRRREVPIWVSKEVKNKIRELAKTHSKTQQSLIRHLLFQYITQAP